MEQKQYIFGHHLVAFLDVLGQLRWCAVALLLAFLPDAVHPQAPDPQALFNAAVQLQQRGETEAAVRQYQHILDLFPTFSEARSNLGAALSRLGRYDEAIANYQLALRQDAGNFGIRLNLGLACYKAGRMADAAREFEAVHTARAENQQALLLLADTWLRLGKNKEVISLLEPVAQPGSADLAVSYLLGTALLRDGEFKRGGEVIAAIVRQGETAPAECLVASAQLAIGEDEKGAQSAARAIALDPTLPDGYSLSGIARERLGDTAGAIADYRKALTLDENDLDASLHLGALLLKERNLSEAERLINRSLRIRPSFLPAEYQLALVHAALGRVDEAVPEFERIAKAAPDWMEPHVQLAVLYYRLNRPADGLRHRQIVDQLSGQLRQKAGVYGSQAPGLPERR
jgi:tetratricopeptide (TPR) repeat protein